MLRWAIPSRDAMVVERLNIREIIVQTGNKAAVVVAAVVVEMAQKETATIAVSRVILKQIAGRRILN